MDETKDIIKEEGNPRKGEDMYGFLFGNNKIQFDNAMAQSQANNAVASLALQQSVSFQQKANDMYLSNMDAREKNSIGNADAREKQRLGQGSSEHNQRMEHENEIETTRQENMRYCLNYLMSMEGPEGLGLVALAKAMSETLKTKE